MFLIVGLGNPGTQYENTRHNVGFMTVDFLWETFSFAPFKAKFDGLIAEGNVAGEKVFLLKPQTFMNLSGNSVVKAANFYKILPQNIIVIHDDVDLVVGKVKAKTGGGNAGHNGLKSVDAAVTTNYHRIRIGVGSEEKSKMINHVLGSFSKQDRTIINQNIKMIADNIDVLIKSGMADFSNKIGMQQHKK